MEDISKFKHNQHPPGELPLSPKQQDLAASRKKQALKWMCKSRASWRTPQPRPEERLQAVAQPEGSSPKQWRIIEEDDMLELNIDPFSEDLVE